MSLTSLTPKLLWQAGHLRDRFSMFLSTHSRQKTCMQRVRRVVFSRSPQTEHWILAWRSRMVMRSYSLEPPAALARSFLRSSSARWSAPSSLVALRWLFASFSSTLALAVEALASLAHGLRKTGAL